MLLNWPSAAVQASPTGIILGDIQEQTVFDLRLLLSDWWNRCSLDCSLVCPRLDWPLHLRTSDGDFGPKVNPDLLSE